MWNETQALGSHDMLADTAALTGIAIVGLFGNALIILCVIVHKKLKNVTSLFVANLAAADMLLAGLVAPGSMRLLWRQQGLPVSPLCQLFGAALYFSCAAVVNFSALIALTRYIVICKSHYVVNLFRHKRAAGWCIALWCYTVLQVVIPSAAQLFQYAYNPVIEVCHLNYTKHPVAIAIYINCFCFLPCLVACIVCYALIFYALRRSRRKLTRHMSSTMSATFLAKKLTRERRATLPLFVSLVSFFVHWLPVMIMFGLDPNFEKYNPKLHRYLGVFSIASACDNWIIYGLLNRNFANGYRFVLCYCFCCKGSSGGENGACPAPETVKMRRTPGRVACGYSRQSSERKHCKHLSAGSLQRSSWRLQQRRCPNSPTAADATVRNSTAAPIVSELEDYSDLDSWNSLGRRLHNQHKQEPFFYQIGHDLGIEAPIEDEEDDDDARETDEFDRINEKCCGAKHRAEGIQMQQQQQQQQQQPSDALAQASARQSLIVVIVTRENCENDGKIAQL